VRTLDMMDVVHKRFEGASIPLAVYERLYTDRSMTFLYESLESKGSRGRYSFLGGKPFAVLRSKRQQVNLDILDVNQQTYTVVEKHTYEGHPLHILRNLMADLPKPPELHPFPGGAIGYAGYDIVRCFEKLPELKPDVLDVSDTCFLFPTELIMIDHVEKHFDVLLYGPQDLLKEDAHRAKYLQRLEAIADVVKACQGPEPLPLQTSEIFETASQKDADAVQGGKEELQRSGVQSNTTKEAFEAAVNQAKEYILAGDIFQVVLAQRLSFELQTTPLRLYEALRTSNPSPYMYFLNLDDVHILGSSPETQVKLEGRKVDIRPLAGTRPRGKTLEEDEALAKDLLADEKERAEHIMLVDLARNDIGRVCEYGSVQTTELLELEHYRRVMHLVSHVQGTLHSERDAFDLFEATFPAGTVSGSPKIRAMEIIEELEPVQRGIYAGAIGYFGSSGDMDMCIAIRTIVLKGNTGHIQAGAGIVADSVPEMEYQETLNKARGLLKAVEAVV